MPLMVCPLLPTPCLEPGGYSGIGAGGTPRPARRRPPRRVDTPAAGALYPRLPSVFFASRMAPPVIPLALSATDAVGAAVVLALVVLVAAAAVRLARKRRAEA